MRCCPTERARIPTARRKQRTVKPACVLVPRRRWRRAKAAGFPSHLSSEMRLRAVSACPARRAGREHRPVLRWHFDDLTQEDTGFSSQQEGREGGREGGGRDTETHRDGDTDRQTDSKNQTDRHTDRQTDRQTDRALYSRPRGHWLRSDSDAVLERKSRQLVWQRARTLGCLQGGEGDG